MYTELDPSDGLPSRAALAQEVLLYHKEAILSHTWCDACNGTGIRDASGELHPTGDIILREFCPACGGKVARLIETGETMGAAEEYP